jgi:glutamyl-tRNA synthetase
VRDEVRGELEAGAEALDDFILIKTDGYPTYNLCHIVDDIDMGVTHVMRGEEFIPSTPKFIALYKALQNVFPEKNITLPKFVTLPPILGETGTKKTLKKRRCKRCTRLLPRRLSTCGSFKLSCISRVESRR